MKRIIYSVRWRRALGVWTLETSGRILGHYDRKVSAVTAGRKAAAVHRSQLRIFGRDGRIQTEHTYGDDPRRYVG